MSLRPRNPLSLGDAIELVLRELGGASRSTGRVQVLPRDELRGSFENLAQERTREVESGGTPGGGRFRFIPPIKPKPGLPEG